MRLHVGTALVALAAALLLSSGCTVTGSGKGKPSWKIYQTEHPRAAPREVIRSGTMELRIEKAVMVEEGTVLVTQGWHARLRGTIRSSEDLPLSRINGAFTLIGTSGQVYSAIVSPAGPRGRAWQHQADTGQYLLPANVTGELQVQARMGDAEGHDELAAFTFDGQRVELPR